MEKYSRELPSFILELTFFSLKICVKRSKIHDMFSIRRKMQHSHAIKGTLSIAIVAIETKTESLGVGIILLVPRE